MKRGAPFNAQRLLVAAPLCHMNGLCTTLFVMASGASEVLMPEFHARHFVQAIERFRCTWLTGVPPMYAMCLREKIWWKLWTSHFATVRMGSAPISLKLWREVEAAFPNALVMNSTTESGRSSAVRGLTASCRPVNRLAVRRRRAAAHRCAGPRR
jgi:acyl-CoA synthetase (AMP-forming)/AMP-acid ligase II